MPSASVVLASQSAALDNGRHLGSLLYAARLLTTSLAL